MAVIQLPCSPVSGRIKHAVEVLERVVPDDYKKGIQLFLGHPDYLGKAEKIKKAVRGIPPKYHLTVHAPFSAHVPLSKCNLSFDEGLETLRKSIRLAEELNAKSLTLHTNTNYYAPSKETKSSLVWNEDYDNYAVVQKEIIEKAFANIKKVAKETKLKLSVENIPIPLHGDRTTNPSDIIYEPCMTTKESMISFAKKFADVKNVGLCFDVCHYGDSRGMINALLRNYKPLTLENIKKEGLGALYPEKLSIQPSMVEFMKEFVAAGGRIFDVQLSDHGEIWMKKTETSKGRKLTEGLNLLEGKSGIEILETAEFAAKNFPDAALSFDIEVKDYENIVEQAAAIIMFLDYVEDKDEINKEYSKKGSAIVKEYLSRARDVI